MKKFFLIIFVNFFFCYNLSLAEIYAFQGCKINNVVTGNYVINIEKNVIEVELKAKDGTVQNFSDKIQSIEKEKVISQKIKSAKGDDIYYQYFLNNKNKSVIKLEYKKQGGDGLEIYKLDNKRLSYCVDVKGGWDKKKIEADKETKEKKEILKAQQKLKEEQEKVFKCQGDDTSTWTDCKGSYVNEAGYKYEGIFKNGKIIRGVSIYPGGGKYVGDFKNILPNGIGTFFWTNGDRYYGSWKDGKTHGDGTKLWTDGTEYSGTFKEDIIDGVGIFYYADGKKYEGQFVNGKRHGEGIFTYPDGTAFVGKFINGKQEGLGTCIALDGSSITCQSKSDIKTKDFSGKDTRKISIVAKKWVRASQYETNSKKGKKIMDKLKNDFEIKANELCSPKTYNTLDKRIEVLEVDETPAYGLETKLKIGINGVVECK